MMIAFPSIFVSSSMVSLVSRRRRHEQVCQNEEVL